jgi:hypothetical protein
MIIFRCMQGVIAGMVYNNLRPLDMAANKETGIKTRGSLNLLTRQELVKQSSDL